MRILILGLVVSAFAMPASAELLTPEGGFQDPRTAETFKAFEDICLPFALHKSELPLAQNIAHHQKMMTERGYGDGQIVQNPYKDFPVGAHTITYSSLTMQGSKVQLIFKPLLPNQVAPYGGISCEVAMDYDANIEGDLAERLKRQEPDWKNSTYQTNMDLNPNPNPNPNLKWYLAQGGNEKPPEGNSFKGQTFTVFTGTENVEIDLNKKYANLDICAFGDPDDVFIQLQIKNMWPAFIEPRQEKIVLRLKATRSDCGKSAE